ncbi:S8 family serine peptidase [bacterium]|nr:S8 family serine peptidase [bacterium]
MRSAPAILLSSLVLFSLVPSGGRAAIPAPHRPGEIIVRFRDAVPADHHEAIHRSMGAELVRPLARGAFDLVRIDDDAALESRIAAYEGRSDVEFAHPNWMGRGGLVPNDTYFGDQWHHRNTGQFGGTPGADIESVDGWDVSTGSAVVVALLDSGIDSDHPEFAGRILPGFDFVNNDADPEDDEGHGTLCAGLLAANADNAFGVAGVNHQCMILPVKVLDADNNGAISWFVDGLDYAVAQAADVVSMSLIDYPGAAAIRTSLLNAQDAGVILVACAGNGGIGNADVSWPGASPRTISIGATTNTDWRAFYSGTGTKLDYVAPGDNVITVAYADPADNTWFFSGCSAATPVAAGIVSVLKAILPAMTQQQTRAFLTAGAEDLVGDPVEDTPGFDEYMGDGRLNLDASIDAMLAATAIPEADFLGGFAVSAGPNPMTERTAVRYTLPTPSRVEISVIDVAGRRVRGLVDGPRPAGSHEARWDGLGDDGRPAAAGVYFVKVAARGQTAVIRITRVR